MPPATPPAPELAAPPAGAGSAAPARHLDRFAALVELSPDAIIVNRDDRIELANAAAAELFGEPSPAALLGRSPLEWFHPDDAEPVRARIRLLLTGAAASVPRRTLTVVRRDGTTRRAEAAAGVFEDARGRALQVVLRDVTQREQYDRALSDAHRQLRDLLESVSDAFYAVDPDWTFTYVNGRTESTWGRGRGELLGRRLWDVFPGAARTDGGRGLRAAMQDRAPARFETYSTFLETWVETFAYPSADGGLSVFFRDITERKQAERAAAESEARAVARAAELEALLDAVPAAVWIARDPGGERIDANRYGADLLALPRGANASLGAAAGERPAHFRAFRDGRELAPGELPIQVAARSGTPLRDVEVDLAFESGQTLHLLGNVTPVADEHGAPRGAVGAFIDITDRKTAEARLRGIAEALPQLVWTADTDGRPDYFNQRWRDYTGQAPGAEDWTPALHPEDRERAGARWRDAVAREVEFEVEHRLRRTDGAFRWFLRRAFPVREADGRVIRWFGTCTDIHELKVSEELLRQSDRLKDDFLRMAAHEFRTPLTALRLQLDLVRRTARNPAAPAGRLEQQLGAVDAQTDRLDGLLGTLLDVTRISANRLVLEPAELDLGALARDVATRFAAEAAAEEVELRVQAEPVVGRWDAARLDQVLTNLVGNALKYGRHRPVDVGVRAAGGAAVVTVRDSGIGIAPEHLPRIFERFERAPNAANFKGLGLGLWIARTLVEAHGGRIEVASRPGEGTTFTVTLPLG